MIKNSNRTKKEWGLKPIILAWIIPILMANFFLGVLLNYYMAKDNDNKRIQDHILQRRMDLILLGNLPDLHTYFMDIKLSLKEEAEFVKDDVRGYLSNYLKNLNPPFPHDLSIISLQGKELIRIKNCQIISELRDFAGMPYLDMLMKQQETVGKTDLPLPVLPVSAWSKNPALIDVLPIYDEINNKVIGGIIYEYNVPIKLLTEHSRNVLIFNLLLGLSIAIGTSLVLYLVLGNIIKPLNRLTSATHEILAGDLSKEIEIQGWGETRLLASTFESMRQQLKNQFDQLEDITRRLREIIDFLPDATLIIDKDRKVIFWNKALEDMTGYSSEAMMGKEDLDCAVPFYGKRESILLSLAFEEALKRKAHEDRIEKYLELKRDANVLMGSAWCSTSKGDKRLLSATASVLFDEKGEIWGAIESIRDITDYYEALQEKEVLQAQLFQSQKMEALGTLAGGVAHDLNNVLGVVVGYAELLLGRVDESSSIRPSLVNIMKGGERAAAIVQDLLTLARRGVPSKNVLNLNRIISDFQQSPEFKNLSSYHSYVQIKTNLEPDLLNISGSPVHLAKTIFNLVSNASESMTKGGILTIKTANQYLDKPIQGYDELREGDYVVLSVSDTGEGIPAADLKRIFEPFYTKKVMGRSGTGLGLAVVWGTVKDHHGYINVESEEGKGSTFTLYFPVTREDISAERIAVAISEYMGKGESILIVDDVKEQRDLAAEMLRKLNYTVTSVSGGEEAVAYLKEHQADLMVLDMIMDPGIDGLDTYKKVLEIHSKQKAIIVSGFSETDRVHDAQALGAGAYVRKPYVIEKLGLAVRKELDGK